MTPVIFLEEARTDALDTSPLTADFRLAAVSTAAPPPVHPDPLANQASRRLTWLVAMAAAGGGFATVMLLMVLGVLGGGPGDAAPGALPTASDRIVVTGGDTGAATASEPAAAEIVLPSGTARATSVPDGAPGPSATPTASSTATGAPSVAAPVASRSKPSPEAAPAPPPPPKGKKGVYDW